MKIEIKSRWDSTVLFTAEAAMQKPTSIERAAKVKQNS
jgi:hypothetical protein